MKLYFSMFELLNTLFFLWDHISEELSHKKRKVRWQEGKKKMMWSGYFCSFFVNSNERFLSNARDHKVMPIKENLSRIQITGNKCTISQYPTLSNDHNQFFFKILNNLYFTKKRRLVWGHSYQHYSFLMTLHLHFL